jgi:hypothetical protein
MVATRETILPGDQAEACAAAYRRYCELDRQLSDYYKQA